MFLQKKCPDTILRICYSGMMWITGKTSKNIPKSQNIVRKKVLENICPVHLL
jgi:hypothetical protein